MKRGRGPKEKGCRDWRWLALWWHHFFLLWSTIDGQTRYSIPEELKQGSVVGNLAKDLGLGLSEIFDRKLRVASDAGKQYFSMDAGKGELVVNDRIDREALCGQSASCVLPLQVVVENPLQSHRIEVEIRDINDNTPSFLTQEINLKIPESVGPGRRFPLENAEDPDVGSNSLKTYTLSKNDHFSLKFKDTTSGKAVPELVLEKPLDREKNAFHQLLLTALDGGTPVTSGTCKITITVLDNNDNFPVFSENEYKVVLKENITTGTFLVKLTATDADDGLNGEVRYSFGSRTPDSVLSTFAINVETGEIILKGPLDYESNKYYLIDITAKDRGVPEMEGHSRVQLDIEDINDNAPEIVLTSDPSPVPEDARSGTVVALISARDLDSGENGKVTLHLSKSSPFALKPSFSNNYELITSGPLDRERSSEYNIEIKATDSGSPPLSSKKIIPVTITDVNDNAPVFTQKTYNVYLKENGVPGSILYSVSASDLDFGENAKEVEDGKAVPELVLEKPLDREKKAIHQLLLTALDGGNPVLSGTSQITITVLDVNDNFPMFEKNTYKVSLQENTAQNTFVVKIAATDADEGPNGEVEFSFGSRTPDSVLSVFEINPLTGEIHLKGDLDYEKASSYKIEITARDKGVPEMESHCRLQIDIVDVNDNTPEIVLTSEPQPVREDAASGTVVALLNARDADSVPPPCTHSTRNSYIAMSWVRRSDALNRFKSILFFCEEISDIYLGLKCYSHGC
uniref:Cadherin domain-containing protein n=1 Tax=Haplochromis burtoni TaxID=8153 RepID=A0A3Q3CQF1_HAPBU